MRLVVDLTRPEAEARLLATGRYTRADQALRTDDLWISVRRLPADPWPTTIEIDPLDPDTDLGVLGAQVIADLAPATVHVEEAR